MGKPMDFTSEVEDEITRKEVSHKLEIPLVNTSSKVCRDSTHGLVGSNHSNLQNTPLLALGYRALRELPRCTVWG